MASRMCGARYGVQTTVCTLPVGHTGWHDDGRGQWPLDAAPDAPRPAATCECPPCPGRANDGHGLTHCAECCFGTGVVADLDCPIHGDRAPRPAANVTDVLAALIEPLLPTPFTFREETVQDAKANIAAEIAAALAEAGIGPVAEAERLRTERDNAITAWQQVVECNSAAWQVYERMKFDPTANHFDKVVWAGLLAELREALLLSAQSAAERGAS